MWENTDQNNPEYGHFLRSVQIPSDPDSLVKKLKRVHFQTRSSTWLNALKATSLSLNSECDGWKVKRNKKMRGDYNGALTRFSGNQLPPFMVKYLKQKQKSPYILLPIGKNKQN